MKLTLAYSMSKQSFQTKREIGVKLQPWLIQCFKTASSPLKKLVQGECMRQRANDLAIILGIIYLLFFLLSSKLFAFLPEGVVLGFCNFAWPTKYIWGTPLPSTLCNFWAEKWSTLKSFPRGPKLWIWLLRGWGRYFKVTLQTCAPKNFLNVDGGRVEGLVCALHRPGRENPHQHERKFWNQERKKIKK